MQFSNLPDDPKTRQIRQRKGERVLFLMVIAYLLAVVGAFIFR